MTQNFIIISLERKKIGKIPRRIYRRKLVLNPTIQQVVINLHTKYDYSSFHSCGEILSAKFHYSKNGKKNKLKKYREE